VEIGANRALVQVLSSIGARGRKASLIEAIEQPPWMLGAWNVKALCRHDFNCNHPLEPCKEKFRKWFENR
jgi:hypothetical protein